MQLVIWLQLVTIVTKLIRLTDQIIASLYLKYFYNRMISLGDMVSSSFVVFARNVLYLRGAAAVFFHYRLFIFYCLEVRAVGYTSSQPGLESRTSFAHNCIL